jgi:hypothetical protein
MFWVTVLVIQNILLNRISIFALVQRYGSVAERLGRALQKLVQRFESAQNLKSPELLGLFLFPSVQTVHLPFVILFDLVIELGVKLQMSMVQWPSG